MAPRPAQLCIRCFINSPSPIPIPIPTATRGQMEHANMKYQPQTRPQIALSLSPTPHSCVVSYQSVQDNDKGQRHGCTSSLCLQLTWPTKPTAPGVAQQLFSFSTSLSLSLWSSLSLSFLSVFNMHFMSNWPRIIHINSSQGSELRASSGRT